MRSKKIANGQVNYEGSNLKQREQHYHSDIKFIPHYSLQLSCNMQWRPLIGADRLIIADCRISDLCKKKLKASLRYVNHIGIVHMSLFDAVIKGSDKLSHKTNQNRRNSNYKLSDAQLIQPSNERAVSNIWSSLVPRRTTFFPLRLKVSLGIGTHLPLPPPDPAIGGRGERGICAHKSQLPVGTEEV